MILVIDVGNSRIKAAVFEDDTILYQIAFTEVELAKNMQRLVDSFSVSDIIVSEVGKSIAEKIAEYVVGIQLTIISRETKFPFGNRYATPHTLGIDRMVLAAGAVIQFPKQNRLIIDTGTCITYDFVDSNDQYLGGGISPGIEMRYKAMNDYTAKLPLLKPVDEHPIIGDSTQASMHSGVINGVLFEIDGVIDWYRLEYPNIIIILTGGDADFLANRLKNTIFANSNFLLESLNQTFQYKSKND